jgi:hypothetical protein
MGDKTKLQLLDTLLYEIRKQQSHGIHTMSVCTVCNKHPARGGGPCGRCLTDELANLIGNGPALSYYNAVNHQNNIVSHARKKFE